MTIDNVDNTTLNNLSPNLDIGDTADPALRLAAFQYIYTEMQAIITELNSIPTANLQNLAVTTAKLAALSVTNAKIATGTLTADKFVEGALENETANGLRITALEVETTKLLQLPNKLEIIAHRGFSDIFPENTLSALQGAMLNGFTSVEFDILKSSDGEFVVIHDPTVDRTTDGTGNVADLTLSELQDLDAGTWKDVKWAGAKIPTLEEYLQTGRGHFDMMYVEFKNSFILADIESIIDIVDDLDMFAQVTFCGFYITALELVRDTNDTVNIAYFPESYDDLVLRLPTLSALGYATMIPSYAILATNPEVVSTCKASGVDVGVYTITTPAQAQAMRDIGVNRMLSNIVL